MIKSYTEFINESVDNHFPSLKKIYLMTKRSSGQRWLTYKGFAGDKFFIQITENNIDNIEINPNYPVLNYHNDITQPLLDKGIIKSDNIYNHPKHIKKSGSKKIFHEIVKDHPNIPKTVFNKKDAIVDLELPIIAKPANGHSGIGIRIIKTIKELDDLDDSKFDIYSQFVDKKEEMRFFLFKSKPIFWMKREPVNTKAKSGEGLSDEKMKFKYILEDVSKIPSDYKKVLTEFGNIFKDFSFICFDIMKDINDNIYIIESNSQPGVPFNSTVEIYKSIYKDFYKEDIDQKSRLKLSEYSNQMIELTLKKDPKRFINNL